MLLACVLYQWSDSIPFMNRTGQAREARPRLQPLFSMNAAQTYVIRGDGSKGGLVEGTVECMGDGWEDGRKF